MPTFERWSIVKVPFPYTDQMTKQRRPALVVATGADLSAPHVLWAMMITSAENRGWTGDIPVTDIRLAGLPAPSVIRTAKVATLDAQDVDLLGMLSDADRLAVRRCLTRILGLENQA